MAAQADKQEFKPRLKGKRKHGDETCEVIKRVKFSESARSPPGNHGPAPFILRQVLCPTIGCVKARMMMKTC